MRIFRPGISLRESQHIALQDIAIYSGLAERCPERHRIWRGFGAPFVITLIAFCFYMAAAINRYGT
jgi:hypothetical protein